VLAKMREMNPEVRVVIATADVQKSTLDQAKAAGAFALINKPLNRDELNRVVSSALQESA
jgi:two-component system, chemotaxis family, chemotaxis protein CheY